MKRIIIDPETLARVCSRWNAGEINASQAAAELGVCRSLLYKHSKEAGLYREKRFIAIDEIQP